MLKTELHRRVQEEVRRGAREVRVELDGRDLHVNSQRFAVEPDGFRLPPRRRESPFYELRYCPIPIVFQGRPLPAPWISGELACPEADPMVLYARKGAHLLAAPPGIPCPGYPDKNQHCLGFIRLARPASFQLGRDRVFRVEYGLVLPPTELTHDLKRPVRGLLSNPVFVELFLAADWPDGRLLELVRLAFACA